MPVSLLKVKTAESGVSRVAKVVRAFGEIAVRMANGLTIEHVRLVI